MHKGPFTESSKPSFIYYPSVGCLEYFSFYIIITFYLFWISALGILQKLCYTCPHPSLFTWPSLTRCLDSLYSFTLLSYLQDLFSIFPLSLLILLPTLKKEKKREKEANRRKHSKLLQSSHLFVSVPIHSVFPSVTLNEQPVFSLKDISSTCTPAPTHCSRNFCLGHYNFPSWLNYSKGIQAFCYFSHLKKKIRKQNSQYHILFLPYLLSFRGKRLKVFFISCPQFLAFHSLESYPISISPHSPSKLPSRLSLPPYFKPIINAPSSSYLKDQQY